MIDDFETVAAIARSTTLDTIQAAIAANEGRLRAVTEMGPAFEQFYNSPHYQEAMREHPRLAEAVVMAESQPELHESHLRDLYSVVWDVAVAKGQAQQGPQYPRRPQAEAEAKSSFAATEQSKRDDLTRNRRALIEELESKGIQDVDFDSVITPSL
jgi:hypothetical protein